MIEARMILTRGDCGRDEEQRLAVGGPETGQGAPGAGQGDAEAGLGPSEVRPAAREKRVFCREKKPGPAAHQQI